MEFQNAKLSIIHTDRKTLSLQVKCNEIIVRAPLKMQDKEIYNFLEEKKAWIEKSLRKIAQKMEQEGETIPYTSDEIRDMANRALEIIPKRVAYYAQKIGVTYGRITIRTQHTRWGSCSSNGNLNFNCLLVQFPEEVMDSIIVHELCHRKHMNHSAEFYAEIDKVFTDYQKCNKWLKENGGAYIRRLP